MRTAALFNNNKVLVKRQIAQNLGRLLILYVYLPFLGVILERVSQFGSYAQYMIYIAIGVCSLLYTRRINIYSLCFLLFFFLSILVNILVVTYSYYVFVEGVQAWVMFAIPVIIISLNEFDLIIFLEKWLSFAKSNIILVFFAIIIFKMNLVNYSIFNLICVPNVFIFAFTLIAFDNDKNRRNVFHIIINLIVIVLLGGRTAALTTLFMCVLIFFFSNYISWWKKVIFFTGSMVAISVIFFNIKYILETVNSILVKIGIGSRSVRLLLKQLQDGKLYLTNRDIIYSECLEYIHEHWYTLGGFGVTLHLTDGKYYYPHNFILQLLIQFGTLGCVLLFLVLLIRINVIKNKLSILESRFIFFSILSFAVVGIANSSIWIHFTSTIPVAMILFYRFDRKNM